MGVAKQIEDIESRLIVGADITAAQAIMYAQHFVLEERKANASLVDKQAALALTMGANETARALASIADAIKRAEM